MARAIFLAWLLPCTSSAGGAAPNIAEWLTQFQGNQIDFGLERGRNLQMMMSCNVSQDADETNADIATSSLANERAEEYCSDGAIAEIDYDSGRSILESAIGGENVLQQVLFESRTQEEMGEKAAEKMPGLLVGRAGGVFIAIIMFWVWCICCYTALPVCQCCRCRYYCKPCVSENQPWDVLFFVKICLLFAVALICIGMMVTSFGAFDGLALFSDGLDTVVCFFARLTKWTLNGRPAQGGSDTSFMGMLPVVNQFTELVATMSTGSSFMNEVTTILDSTEVIKVAVKELTETLSLLETVLAANQAVAATQMHKCITCEALQSPINAMRQSIEGSVASSLDGARASVEEQLSPSSRSEMQCNMQTTADPLRGAASAVRGMSEVFLGDGFKEAATMMTVHVGTLMGFVAFLTCAVVCLAGCAGVSWLLFDKRNACMICCPAWKEDKNPYNPTTHRVACCTWCNAFVFSGWAFFIGGLMMMVASPLSMICLVMDDLNGDSIRNMGGALGMNTTDEGFGMMVDLIDQCFTTANMSNGDLMEILVVNGTTMGQTIKGNFVDPMDQQFAEVAASMNSGQPPLSTDQNLINMENVFGQNPINTVITIDPSLAAQIVTDLGTDTIGDGPASNGVSIALSTGLPTSAGTQSTPCGTASSTPISMTGTGLGTLLGANAPTVYEVIAQNVMANSRYAAGGVTAQTGTCIESPASCAGAPAHCAAFQDVATKKAALTNPTADVWRCDLFTDSNGNICDPLTTPPLVSGSIPTTLGDTTGARTWGTTSCVPIDGSSATQTQRTCTLDEFVTYMREWEQRLQRIFLKVDDITAQTQGAIGTDLQAAVSQHLKDPVVSIVEGANCKFLAEVWGGIVDGLCYQSVAGFVNVGNNYIVCGVFAFFLIVVMYVIWRITIDNYNLANKDTYIGQQSLK